MKFSKKCLKQGKVCSESHCAGLLPSGGVGEKGEGKVWVVPFAWQRGLGRGSPSRVGHNMRYQNSGPSGDGGVGTMSLEGQGQEGATGKEGLVGHVGQALAGDQTGGPAAGAH
jgi:hypothetical protein